MKIGTDVNLWTCRAEGYLMMEFNSKKLVVKGELQKNVTCRFTATFGYLSHKDSGAPLYPGMTHDELYRVDTYQDWDCLVETYQRHKPGIDSFAETDKQVNFDNPTP